MPPSLTRPRAAEVGLLRRVRTDDEHPVLQREVDALEVAPVHEA